jgi:hypothetical protein
MSPVKITISLLAPSNVTSEKAGLLRQINIRNNKIFFTRYP